MVNITLSLPEDLQKFVESESATRGGTSTGEYLCKLIEEARQQKLRDQIEELLEEGLESGNPIEVTEAYWAEKQQRLAARSAQAKQGADTQPHWKTTVVGRASHLRHSKK